MEKAIKKAIEGGYKKAKELDILQVDWSKSKHKTIQHIQRIFLLDPLFWQALAKRIKRGIEGEPNYNPNIVYGEWIDYWHNFIDHLAQGEDINSFFEELLK